jgi:hypothetical protein
MVNQVLDIPIPFVFLPDNRPQLLSISPKSVSIDGGSHTCAFIQPAAYNFVSAQVFIDRVQVSSTIMLNGSVINFVSPAVPSPLTSSVLFAFQGLQCTSSYFHCEYFSISTVLVWFLCAGHSAKCTPVLGPFFSPRIISEWLNVCYLSSCIVHSFKRNRLNQLPPA